MFRTLFIVLALAVYGGYSLLSNLWEKAPSVAPELDSSVADPVRSLPAKLNVSAFDLAGSAASLVTGVELQDAPAVGCSDSLLSPQQVLDLLEKLPEPQRVALAKALQASSAVWAAQLYQGELGLGLCLPAQGKLLRFPAGATSALPALPFTAESITDAVQSFAGAVSN